MAVFAGSWGVLFPMKRIGKILLNVMAIRLGCLLGRSCSLSVKFGKDGLACFCRVAVLFCDFIRRFLFWFSNASR